MSSKWIPIRYRDFYDFPRAFVAEQSDELFFFDCPFDDVLDDYKTEFIVFKINKQFSEKVDQRSWENLRQFADRVGAVSTGAVRFDETKRKAVNADIFDLIS